MTSDRANKLRELEMTETESEIAKQLADVLEILKEATLYFSRKTPNLPHVIPAMDEISNTFSTQSESAEFNPAIRQAILIAQRTLDRYYNRTEESDVYRIAMTRVLQVTSWDEESIEAALKLVTDEFDEHYKDLEIEEVGDEVMEIEKSVSLAKNPVKKVNRFDKLNLPAPRPNNLLQEIERYIGTDIETIDDALKWWYDHRAEYPRLSRMAMDYLSIPATSVDIESIFSPGKLVLSHVRSRLSVESTRALICNGIWSKQGLIKDKDVVTVTQMAEVEKGEDDMLEDDWDLIKLLS